MDEALEFAQVADLGDRRTDKLSGGQTQRVRFAIALISNPDLLVLDEPTVGMDVEARHAFWETVRGFADRGKTVIFATHYLEEADSFADRAVLMARGRVVADGPTTEIKAMVGSRRIRATLPEVGVDVLEQLPGVTQRRAARRSRRAGVLRLGRRHPGAPGRGTGGARHRDRRRGARRGVPAAHRRRRRRRRGRGVNAFVYARYELTRTFRNRRLFIFSFGFPLVLFYAIAGPNRHVHNLNHTGISAPMYFMVGLASFGTMNAVLASGARIAGERTVGWNRQLRLTPLSVAPTSGSRC